MENTGTVDPRLETIPEVLPAGSKTTVMLAKTGMFPVLRKSRKRRPRILILSAIFFLAVVLVIWVSLHHEGGIEYRTVPVERGTIEATVSATGSPNAVVTVQVGSQVSGNISALYADFNTSVKKNQLVARIDPAIFQARVNQAYAGLEAANAAVVNSRAGVAKAQAGVSSAGAALATAKANVLKAQVAVDDGKVKYDRRVTLADQGVISPDDLDTAKATYDSAKAEFDAASADERAAEDNLTAAKAELDVATTQLTSAEAQVKQAKASLAQAQLDLDHTYIRAPVDGVVVSRNVDVGQTVAASLQAPTLFLIAQDLTKMQVDTNVSEADVSRVKVNQEATFTVDAFPGQIFHGVVSQIRQAAINVQNVITYDAVIAFSNQDLKLFPGMTANVKILVARHENALKVANAALRFRPADASALQQGSPRSAKTTTAPTLWMLGADKKLTPVPVQLGITDGTFTEITSGSLKEGDQAVVAALSSKNAGSPATSPVPGPRF